MVTFEVADAPLTNGHEVVVKVLPKTEATVTSNGERVVDTSNGHSSGNEISEEAGKTSDEAKTADEKEENKIPVGMTAESKALYGKKDAEGKYQWSVEEPTDVVEAAENEETAKYAFIVRNAKSYDSRKKYQIDSIIVQSPLIKSCLSIALKDYPGVTTNLDRLIFKAPFQPFVHRWNQIVMLLDSKVTEDEETRKHLGLFHDVLFEEIKDAIAARNDLVKNGVITFEYLWTIFEPGMLIYSNDDGKERLYEFESSLVCTDQKRGLDYLRLQTWYVDWDGEKFGSATEFLADYEFEGTTPISALTAFPLDFHPQKEQLIERLLKRGSLFEQYSGYHYQAYKGVALGYGRTGMVKYNIDSRIIIDCEAHNRFVPNQGVYFNALGKSGTSPANANYDGGQEIEGVQSATDGMMDFFRSLQMADSVQLRDSDQGRRPLTTKELLLSVPFVRGYAMKIKKWLLLFVDQIVPVKFAENAFASLVLPEEQKRLIRAFVESQAKHKDSFDDIIAGKGKGMIMLLAGPPGVGKTLTAESVAEMLKVPVYMLSAGDLGVDPYDIENTLNTVMDMTAKWNAVLLLDEADVFLEARNSRDLERNKMVSIFLRVLEYYEGTMFLTTNRIGDIDQAFHSRIHVTMRYPELSTASQRHIWRTFLDKDTSITSKDLDELVSIGLNGRQIKNLLKTARMLAYSPDENTGNSASGVEMRHIRSVLAIEQGYSRK